MARRVVKDVLGTAIAITVVLFFFQDFFLSIGSENPLALSSSFTTETSNQIEKSTLVEPQENRISNLISHRYVAGVHTFEGIIDMPTPCHTLEGSVSMASPHTITIALITKAGEGVCAQVITPQTFSVSLANGPLVEVKVTLNVWGVMT